MNFDPNGTGQEDMGIFSLPFSEDESQLILLPVPWEVTTSFGDGCSYGPEAIFASSKQLDLCDALYGTFYEKGIYQRPASTEIMAENQELKKQALLLKKLLENGLSLNDDQLATLEAINQASKKLNHWVQTQSEEILAQGKFCGLIGGDHSSPLGLIKALSEKHPDLSILHIDAHMDLRQAYQGYQYSHASVMYNVLQETSVQSLVQLGIRDFCPQELEVSRQDPRVHTFFDSQASVALARGESWQSLALRAINKLTDKVYISFDIDGLMPELCPHTGTPVPGGISFAQMEALLYQLSMSKKQIVGFDLCEVSPGPDKDNLLGWDGNVGARVLFKLAGALLHNNN